MKLTQILAALVVVGSLILSGCYGITGECGGGMCSDAQVADASNGDSDASISGGDASDSSADANKQDSGNSDASADNGSDQSDATVGPDVPCPPKDRPDAKTLVSIQSGELCVATEIEKEWALDIDGRKWQYVESCGTIDSSLCTQNTKFYDVGYTPPNGFAWDPSTLPTKLQGKYVLQIATKSFHLLTSYDSNKATFEMPVLDEDHRYAEFERKSDGLYMTIRWVNIKTNEESVNLVYKGQ